MITREQLNKENYREPGCSPGTPVSKRIPFVYFLTVVLLTLVRLDAALSVTVLFAVVTLDAMVVFTVAFWVVAFGEHLPRNSAHSSQDEPFGNTHIPYSAPVASFLISVLPPIWPQYTEAGFARPVVFCSGAAVVTTTLVVGTAVGAVVAAVVEGVVADWFDVQPAVIITAATKRTRIIDDVFIQLMEYTAI